MANLKIRPADARTKYNQAVVNAYLTSLERGASMSSASEAAGICLDTIYTWRAKHPEFAEFEHEILARRAEIVEDALYTNAISGDTKAQIFWLKNRAPKRWRDAWDFKHEGKMIISAVDLVRELEQAAEGDADTQIITQKNGDR